MRTIFLFKNRINTHFVAIGKTKDLFALYPTSKHSCVFSVEAMIFLAISFSVRFITTDYTLKSNKSSFEESFHTVLFTELSSGSVASFRIYPSIVETSPRIAQLSAHIE